MSDHLEDAYEVVVVGGGAAGLNGALMLARSRRTVVVLDAGEPRNAPADGVHGLLGHDGIKPAELLATGRGEVRRYGGHVVRAAVDAVHRDGDGSGAGFVVALADGRTVRARRILVATGLVDDLPDLPGLRERWGHDVVHCPYCHGWEVRDQAIGVLATGPMSVHQALLFRQLSDDVVYFTDDRDLAPGQAGQLAAVGVQVKEGRVTGLEAGGLRLADGALVAREAVVVAPRMRVRADFLAPLGLRPVEHPSGAGDHLPTDQAGQTPVPGVYAAGNVTDPSAQVGAAAAAGAWAGARINAELVMAAATVTS
ncbi:NAD(P)/FAD-dependent oxidoreductase [Hamadaea tsunoensis]|uniref:NAD(P)/FAD-dependent oxidoreductase n=1 Tax=Hamadaea tsunoensis TaxID=53368 RepID=UPI001B7FD54F|nr:NAD(P)/FAD-dependent oxidoreductase [Hamadaea tsunoensis]